jgi:energy-coupling factor transporter ATP-binding protein EcfA2
LRHRAVACELASVSFAYGSTPVFVSATATIYEGECALVCGRSGSGKTTLLDLMAGVVRPNSGVIRLFGSEVVRLERVVGQVAYLISEPERYFFETTVVSEVALALRTRSRIGREEAESRARAALRTVGLDDSYDERDPVHLSRGEKRRVAIAALLVTDARVFLLDEPLIGLDYEGSIEVALAIMNLVQDGATVVVATHELDPFLFFADRLFAIADSRLLEAPLDDVESLFDVLRAASLVASERIELSMLAQKHRLPLDVRASEIDFIEQMARALAGEVR